MGAITVYGSETCEDTERSLALLERMGSDYEYVDVDHDARAASYASELNHGHLKTPTITFEHTDRVLIEPTDDELAAIVRESR
jgi:mycoredoxin